MQALLRVPTVPEQADRHHHGDSNDQGKPVLRMINTHTARPREIGVGRFQQPRTGLRAGDITHRKSDVVQDEPW